MATLRVTDKQQIIHLVDVEKQPHQKSELFTTYETRQWCEDQDYSWSDPPFTREPVTCLFCAVAKQP